MECSRRLQLALCHTHTHTQVHDVRAYTFNVALEAWFVYLEKVQKKKIRTFPWLKKKTTTTCKTKLKALQINKTFGGRGYKSYKSVNIMDGSLGV